jgi:hypothetical protein
MQGRAAAGHAASPSAAQANQPESGRTQIVVEEKPAQIQVTKKPPEVTVHQPAPNVTVQQPPPEVSVRQTKPEVATRQAAPQVQVESQGRPAVQVPRGGQPDVRSRAAGAAATAGAGGSRPAWGQTTAGQPQAAAGNARRQTPFDAFDSNGDGHISRTEATPSLRRQWSQIDTNRDGTLERSELSAFEQQLRSDAREQGGRKQ